ncbi:MAG: hypothetical protein H0T19_08840, partial [Thermoleophilaceae bacterium]|nr:hypothetical protein [Thermoleophilaceae bacterium]
DGSVDGTYSDADKRAALKQLPADLDEYSDCRAAIKASIGGPKAGISNKPPGPGGGDGSAGGSGGGQADTNGDGKVSPAERKAADNVEVALKRDKDRTNTENTLGDRKTDPGKVGAIDADNTSNGLPLPVILAIAALALLAAAAATLLLGRRSPRVANALRRVPLPARFRR